MNMWQSEMNDEALLKILFAGQTIIKPISRMKEPLAKPLVAEEKPVMKTLAMEMEAPISVINKIPERVLDLKNEARKPSYPKYSFILSRKIEAYSDEARMMIENIVTKALALSMNQVEIMAWEKPAITIFDLNVKGPGCYFIFGVNCLGQKGLMKSKEVAKTAGQLIITAEDPELLRLDTEQRSWLWSVMKTNAF